MLKLCLRKFPVDMYYAKRNFNLFHGQYYNQMLHRPRKVASSRGLLENSLPPISFHAYRSGGRYVFTGGNVNSNK